MVQWDWNSLLVFLYFQLINLVFIVYYLMEQSLKLAALGWRRYIYNRGNIFDGLVTVVLVVSWLELTDCMLNLYWLSSKQFLSNVSRISTVFYYASPKIFLRTFTYSSICHSYMQVRFVWNVSSQNLKKKYTNET